MPSGNNYLFVCRIIQACENWPSLVVVCLSFGKGKNMGMGNRSLLILARCWKCGTVASVDGIKAENFRRSPVLGYFYVLQELKWTKPKKSIELCPACSTQKIKTPAGAD